MLCLLGPNLWITFFVVCLHNVLKKRSSYVSLLFNILRYFLLRHNYVIYLFDVNTFFVDARIALIFYAWITYGNSVTVTFFLLVIVTYFYYVTMFSIVTFFDNVRITLYFGTFELRMEISLRLRFVFVPHCDVFLINSQLSYLFVRCNHVFWWR